MVRSLNESNIPDDWKYGLLDEFAQRGSGHTPSKSFPEYWNGGVKWISLTDSSSLDNGYIYNTQKEISEEGISNSSAVLHPAETVVLSRDAGVGKSAVMATTMAVSQHFIAWRCDNDTTINSWYLYNWLQVLKPEFERHAIGSTIKTIGLSYFKKLKIGLPPIKEQNKIAKILTTWDKAITTTEKLLANSQQQKKALMQQLLTGKKRFEEFSDVWSEVLLGDISNITTGSSNRQDSYLDGKYAFFDRSEDIRTSDQYLFDCEAVIVPGEGQDFVPKYFIGKFDLHQRTYAITNFEGCDGVFIFYLISHFRRYFLSQAVGSTVKSLRLPMFLKMKLKIPAIKEQKNISLVLSNLDENINNLKQKLDCLKQEKKSLMQQLLTGKRRVKVAS